jgi:hypothetical protein
MELVLDLVKNRADGVGKDAFLKLLEDTLEKTKDSLTEERVEHHKVKRELGLVQKQLTSTEAELTHISLMVKMYSGLAEPNGKIGGEG